MPLNPGIILSIISEECESINERYDGYKEDFVDLITEIIDAERRNLAQRTNIQQDINELCESAGDLLVESRSPNRVSQEEEL